MRVKDRKSIVEKLKHLHTLPDRQNVYQELEKLIDSYQKHYPKICEMLNRGKENLFTYLEFPKAIRRTIYTTNVLESFNKQVKRYTKQKEQFPNEESLERFICQICIDYNNKFSKRIHLGFGQLDDC